MIVKDPLIVNPLRSPLTVSFLAPASNTGRTSVLTNLAWLFARHRRHTLVLDLSGEGAEVHDYLGPFLAEELAADQILGTTAAELLDGTQANGATGRRYAVGQGRLDVIRSGAFDTVTARRLRDALRDSPYAYVLVDASTENTPAALAAIAELSDRVAVCLSPQSSNVREAARLTGRVFDQRPGNLPVVLVASHFGGDQEQEDRSRGEIFREFGALGHGPIPLSVLPPHPYFDYLALLKEPAGSPVREAYARLASALVPGDPIAAIDVPPSLSNRYVTSMDLRAGSGRLDDSPARIQVLYHPADQLRMEWLSRQLDDNGIEVTAQTMAASRARLADGPVVVIASPSGDLSRLDQMLPARTAGAAEPELVVVRLPDAVLPASGPAYAVVDLSDAPAKEVPAGRLFGALGMAGAAVPTTDGPRRLFAQPEHVNLFPARDLPFLGRDHEIGAMREMLTRPGHQAVVVQADSGMGKTALVREYYERFGADYVTAWWITANDARTIRRSLTELGDELGVWPRGDIVAATIATLSRTVPPDASPPGRWLLVYDGVGDLADLEGLLPSGGHGHVVITTQDPGDPMVGGALPLDPLERKEVVDGLIALVDRATDHQVALSHEDAADVVDAVRANPIGVRLVCTYLLRVMEGPDVRRGPDDAVVERAELLRTALTAVREATASAGDHRGLLELVLELLEQDPYGRRARRLAEMCAFLSPAGADLRLLRAPEMLARLSSAADGEFTFDDIDRTIWTGARMGLFSVRWPELDPLRTVPALQRMLLDRMTPEEQADRRRQVRRGLAAVANALPWDADIRMRTAEARWTATIYTELQRHMTACAVLADDEPATREWVVRQFRALARTADQASLRYAEPTLTELCTRWQEEHPADLLTLRLANELTNVLRGLGRYAEALELDERMLRDFVGILGRDHFRILVVRRGIAADQRALGQFTRALALDQSTSRYFADTHGAEHPETLTAGHNLAVSQALAGQLPLALETERRVYQGRLRLLGDNGRQSLWSELEIGIYTRELGDFAVAASLLFEVDKRMKDAHLPREHAMRLRARRHGAIASRLAGKLAESRGALGPILESYEGVFGPEHPQSWATRLSLAAEENDAGSCRRAAELAGSVLAHYESHLGDHPFTAGARANLAVYLLGAEQEADAAAQADRAHAELLGRLGEGHPWTIGALLGRVLVAAVRQNHAAAAALAAEAQELAVYYLPHQEGLPIHPCVEIADEWQRLLREGQTINALLGWPPNRRRHLEITIPET